MEKTHRSHEDATVEMLRNDPTLAAEYLDDVLATGDDADLMLALRYLSKAFGGVQRVAGQNCTLSETGNPSVSTLRTILDTMGLRLAVQRIN